MPSKVNKLYIDLAAAVPTTLGAGNRRVVAFPLTQAVPGTTVASDKYGNFLRDFAPISAGVSALQKAKLAVSAFFQAGGLVTVGAAQVALDFIAASGVATTAASIDPVATRHFRLRAVINRLITAAEFARVTANGTIFVQRQHTIEV